MRELPQDVIRRYLDEVGGRQTVEVVHLKTTWRVDRLTEAKRQMIVEALEAAGVKTEPPLAEAEEEGRITLYVEAAGPPPAVEEPWAEEAPLAEPAAPSEPAAPARRPAATRAAETAGFLAGVMLEAAAQLAGLLQRLVSRAAHLSRQLVAQPARLVGRAGPRAAARRPAIPRLAPELRAPGVLVAGLGAVLGALGLFGAGLVFASVFPDESALDLSVENGSLVPEALRHAASFTLANFEVQELDRSLPHAPLVTVLLPIGACVLAVSALAPRLAETSPRGRAGWGLATGLPFALIMLLVALVAGSSDLGRLGELEPSPASVCLLSLVWGGLGGLIGVELAGRRAGWRPLSAELPAGLRQWLALLDAALRPLALVLVACALIGTAVLVLQSVRNPQSDFGDLQSGRSAGVAAADAVMFGGDHAVHWADLGAAAKFETALSPLHLPLPVEDVEELAEVDTRRVLGQLRRLAEADAAGAFELVFDPGGSFRIYDYGEALPGYAFAALLLLTAIPALMALYAGASVARARAPTSPGRGAAWGALVGPLWALAMVLLSSLANDFLYGNPDLDSVFSTYLIAGAVLGALGGLVASQPERPAS